MGWITLEFMLALWVLLASAWMLVQSLAGLKRTESLIRIESRLDGLLKTLAHVENLTRGTSMTVDLMYVEDKEDTDAKP